MSFKKLLSPVLLGLCLSQALALPSAGNLQESFTTIDVLNHHHPEVLYETYGEGIELPSGLAKGSVEETAVSFAMYKLGVSSTQVVHSASFASDITDHAYLSQVHNGIPFVNAVANVAMKDGKVVAFGSSFVKTEKIASSQPFLDKTVAIAIAEAALGCTYDSYPTSLQYLANPDGSSSLVHVVQVKNDETGEYYQAHVDAHTGKLVSMVNFVAEATYTAVPITNKSIMDGQSVLVNPQNMTVSPLGWHKDTLRSYNTTRGNNGQASRTATNHFAGESSRETYAYRYNTSQEPNDAQNLDASIVNAFYLMNMVHDVTYRYGFTETGFNFQMSNFNRGGRENDGIVVSVNDATRDNNAAFTTLPDGQPGRCQLYLFKYKKPFRPAAMDNSVVVHEFGHGVSNRLVGGGTATCLTTPESKGLGEGWSDTLANWMTQTSAITKDFMIGTYLAPTERRNGFRTYPYTIDKIVNPSKYSDVAGLDEEHKIGEIWANMLHNVYAELVSTHGYAKDAMINPFGTAGNVVFMHLFIDSFSLLPCRPNFIAARNGLIQADENRYHGQNRCLLWRVFASRGLGYSAGQHIDDNELPPDC